MRIVMLGVNHRTASVDVREKLTFAGDRLDAAIADFRNRYPFAEIVLLCTCNRTELYVARPVHEPPDADELRELLAEQCGLDVQQVTAVTIHREQEAAVNHLFRVAAGLESMVLGEPQILGQVKRAYEAANRHNAVGPVLHRVFQETAAVAKQIRKTTGIDAGRTSVGSVAVDFAKQIFDRFEDKTVVGVGAGEMGKLVLQHMKPLAPKRLWVTSRTLDRAESLAAALQISEDEGGARSYGDLDPLLVDADVVVCCTGSNEPILDAKRLQPVQKKRRRRPLILLDLAVPRDVAEDAASLQNVYVYNIDDLQRVIDETTSNRENLVADCEQLIHDGVRACLWDIQHRDIGRLIKTLRHRLSDIGRAETQRTAAKLQSADDAEAERLVEEHTHRLINKILHAPLSKMDRRNVDAPLGFYAAALRRLFDLDEVPPAAETLDEAASEQDAAEQQETHAAAESQRR